MPYGRIRQAKGVLIGTNQTTKALVDAKIAEVFVAKDADKKITIPILQLCEQQEIPCEWVESMKSLGKACGIQVGAAVVAIKKDF